MSACGPSDRLMQTIKLEAPGVTDPMLQIQVFNVVDEFCRRTSAWRYREDVDLEVGLSEYQFSLPVDAAIVRVLGVGHNGSPLRATGTQSGVTQSSLGTLIPELTFGDGDAQFAPAQSDLSGGLFSYAIYRPNYISVTAAPDVEAVKYPLNVALALTIAKGCLECDCGDWGLEDWMWDMFHDEWRCGVLGRLYGMPAKPWANPTQALYFHKRFRNQMAQRKQEATKGFAFGVPGWQFPNGGWT